jgi:pimeloyl-ACP methyl ester carboxylesterase
MKETAINFECIDVPGAGHVVSLDKPEAFNMVVGKWIAGS